MEDQPSSAILTISENLIRFDPKTHIKRMNLLGIQPQLLYVCGILTPNWFSKSTFRSVIFKFYSNLLLLWFLPHITSQIMALYQHMNRFATLTDLIFQLALFIHTVIITFYFVTYKSQLAKILDLLESQFTPYFERICILNIHKPLIEDVTKQGTIVTKALLGVLSSCLLSWGVFPAMVRYYDLYFTTDQEKDESLNITEEYIKYFGLVVWLPPNVNEFPVYELVYIFDFIGTVGVACNCSGVQSIFLVIMFTISTHFKIIIASIQNIPIKFPEILKQKKYVFENNGPNTNLNILSMNVIALHPNRPDTMIDSDTEYNNMKSNSDIIHSEDLLNPELEERVYKYLVNLTKYHQILLEFCKDVNDFLSPVLLVFVLGCEAMVCFAAFRLALELNEGNFKFFTSAVSMVIWLLIICWYGEHLIEQSIKVQVNAYDYNWINQSTRIKKLLQMIIMRAQNPVKLTAGKFYPVSLQTFAEIGNKVYAFYTLLKQMLADSEITG
ncbi:Odorant receptor 12 [Blattella germanica]|nr:Odorant receptor 12 [Blattella germanica]